VSPLIDFPRDRDAAHLPAKEGKKTPDQIPPISRMRERGIGIGGGRCSGHWARSDSEIRVAGEPVQRPADSLLPCHDGADSREESLMREGFVQNCDRTLIVQARQHILFAVTAHQQDVGGRVDFANFPQRLGPV
jgi:hypothetical protein